MAALCVLVVGWLAAVAVYVMAGSGAPGGATGYTVVGGQTFAVERGESRGEQMQLERMNGKVGTWMVGLDDWIASMTHGRNLAYTLALVSAAVAGGCCYLAGLADEDEPD
jgi:hypothetical protein